jgi:glycosyltransferase involved in cell wall biosynthesis
MLFTKGTLHERIDDGIAAAAPRDFYYGFLALLQNGIDARMQSTSAPYPGRLGPAHRFAERVWARLTGISRRHHFLDLCADDLRAARIAVSFTDHFSLTLGNYFARRKNRPYTVGIFHGLSDFEQRLTPFGRWHAKRYLRRALGGLDHVAFLSPADRDQAIACYGLARAATSVFHFGVDTAFWTPEHAAKREDEPEFHVVSVGSDPSRDYETLLAADLGCPLEIVTALAVTVPPTRPNVKVTTGNFFSSPLSDAGLRDLYRHASVIAVPLKDVFQPSGQSVTLQAMACARPVVLSRNKGLWAPEILIDGKNCLLVPPGDWAALAAAIERLKNDGDLARRLGAAARKTVEAHFTLAHMDRSLAGLVSRAAVR